MSEHSAEDVTPTRCDRCGYGLPFVHDLTEVERMFAIHFLTEIYAGEGEPSRSSYPPEPVGLMLRNDPHYVLCQTAIRRARRLLLAFPGLSNSPATPTPPTAARAGTREATSAQPRPLAREGDRAARHEED